MILNNKLRHTLFPVMAAAIWGSAFVAQSMVADKVSPLTFNMLRSSVAVLTLLILTAVFAVAKKLRRGMKVSDIALGGLVCGAALTAAMFLQQSAMSDASSGKAGFVTALYIILVPVFRMIGGKKAPARVWCAVASASVGLYFLCVKENFVIVPSDILLLGCTVMFALHIMAVDVFVKKVDGIVLSCSQFFFVTIFSGIGAFICEDVTIVGVGDYILPLLYVGVFSSGIAYTLQILSQKDADPSVVSLLMSLESVFSVIFGAVILHEKMTGREYIGCVLMFCASTLAQLPDKKKNEKSGKA